MLNKLLPLLSTMFVIGCASNNPSRPILVAQPLPAEIITKIIEKPIPQLVVGQLKPIETLSENKSVKAKNVGEILEQKNEIARQRPTSDRFFNSITMYDYMPGTLYQVYAAPGNLTTIFLQPGEEISHSVMTGDSATWRAQVGTVGEGLTARQAIYLKPLLSRRKTSMVIPTNKRVYHLELTSFINSYMASVQWNYHEDKLIPLQQKSDSEIKPATTAENLNFNYKIKKHKGSPAWLPKFVFDDGSKTFIKFDKTVNNQQIPAVFVTTAEEKVQIVNYRYQNETIVIDRIIDTVELRLGKKRPELVKITRCS